MKKWTGCYCNLGKKCILDFIEENPSLLELTNEEIDLLVEIVAPFGRLDLGSPSSPIISNIIMKKFDEELSIVLSSVLTNPIYTRYSDDITISSNKDFDFNLVLNEIENLLKGMNLELNNKKTKYTHNKDNIKITGVFINKDEESKSFSKLSVGTSFKRKLKQKLYTATKKKPTLEEARKINGMLSFVKDIEPDYHAKLILKYSDKERSIFYHLKEISSEN